MAVLEISQKLFDGCPLNVYRHSWSPEGEAMTLVTFVVLSVMS